MVDMLISGRSVLADVNRQTNPLATVTIAPSEEPPTGIPGTTRTISSSQPAQLSTLGGFKSALAEFRNAATTLTALAKILNLKPLFTESVPEAANPDAPPAQTADEAGFFVATGKPAPASGQNPAIRPALLLNDSSLIDANLPQSRPQTGLPTASTSDPLATSSQSAAVLTQAIQTFVTAHNRLVTVLTQLADPGEASTPESLTGGEEALKSGQSGVARHTSPDSEHRPSLLQPFRDVGQPANRAGGVPTNAGHSSALLLTPTVLVGTPKFTSDPVTPEPAGDQSGGNGGFASHVAAADLGKQARRLLDTLTMVTTRLPGLQAAGLTSGQNGELRLDAGRLQAAMAAQPRTITKLFSTMDLNPDEAQPSPSSLPLRPSGSIATPSPLTVLNSALADFQEKTRVVTGLARLLANPTPVADRSPEPVITAPLLKTASGEVARAMPRPAPPTSAQTTESLYLNQEETLISTALLRSSDRLAPMTLQFQIGHYDAVAQRFLADPQQAPVNVALSDGNDTLPGLRDAIQAGNPDLGAAVVKDSAGYRLAMRLPGETMAHSIAVNISKAANSPAASEGQLLGFTVQRDADAVRNTVQSFVGAYNRLNSAAGSLSGNLDALAGPLRQSLVGTMANPERGRALAQAGVMVQRDGSLLIEPVRLSTATETHPKQVLDLFVEPEAGEDSENGLTTALADSFNDWLSEIRDSKEPWDSQLDDQSPKEALNSDDGQRAEGGLLAVEMRYRTRLETVSRLAQQLFSNELWLRQELERLSGLPDGAGVTGVAP
ncbi:MAG: flagellar filament capping protein FliD [Gammaproteobacteria bacterium]|nr:flagellar filament capping protein FliD [Gammaproteobacteria bacterium]